MVYDVIILGSGPAGFAAAIYTSRGFLSTLVISGMEPGGQLTTTTEIDNFPGFPKGILGPRLMLDMKAQAERFQTVIKDGIVTSVDFTKQPFTVFTADTSYQGKSVIIATGASAQYLGLPSEERLRGKGVSACATCDGFFFRGKEVAVAGGGDTAMEEAHFLTTFASKVTIIHRREEFRASPIMLDRAKKNPKIMFLTNTIIEEVLGESAVTGLKLKNTKTGEESTFATQGLFLAIGHKPNTVFLNGMVELDGKGYVITYGRLADEYLRGKRDIDETKMQKIRVAQSLFNTHTSVRGIFAAGDCVDFQYRQAIVAAGQGCMAALDVQKWLSEQK